MAFNGSAHLAKHLESVADLSAALAVRAGISPGRARLAAALHDRLKPLSPARLAGIMRQCGESMDNETKLVPALWHGYASAALARHRSGMRDRDILEAVRWHTTGKAGMSALGNILFVADFCSADRMFPEAVVGRRLALRNLQLGIRFVLASKLVYLMGSGIKPHSASLGFWSSLFRGVAGG